MQAHSMTAEHGSHRPEVQVVDRHVACVMTADDTVRAAVRFGTLARVDASMETINFLHGLFLEPIHGNRLSFRFYL